MLDKNAPHHFSVAQPAAHPSAADDTDPQGLARLSEKLHSEEGTNIGSLEFYGFHFKAVTFDTCTKFNHTVRYAVSVCVCVVTHFLGWFQML